MGFWAALEFLTIIPTPLRGRTEAEIGRSLVYFPLVGLLLGMLLGGLDWALRLILPLPLASALLLAGLVVVTGALHLDGFMDTCDGLGGHTPQARLEIMKDSRAGAFGVVAVALLLLVKYSALVSLPPTLRAGAVVLMPVLGRWAMVLAVTAFPYARPQGLGKAFAQHATWPRFAIATPLAVAVAWITGLWAGGLAAFLGVGLMVWGAATYLRRKFNGLTGDNYGALSELAETWSLIMFLPWHRLIGA